MKSTSIYQDIKFDESKPAIKVVLETDFTKEIRILMKKNQEMKEHKTPFPIVIEVVEGIINFGIEGKEHRIVKGDLLTLSGGIPHSLVAIEESIIRLTLSKSDSTERVKKVSEK